MAMNTVETKKVEEETKEKIEQEKTNKPSKWSKFWSEFKSFLIIILIIGLVGLGGWYWYTHMKDHSKPNEEPETKEKEVVGYDYKVIERSYKLDYCEGCNGKYLIYGSKHNNINKIYDTTGKLLYEGDYDYNGAYEGLDNTLYIIKDDIAEEENVISVNRLKDGEIEHLYKISKENVMFRYILYKDENDDYYLLGFVGELVTNETGKNVLEKTFVVNLDNEMSELDGYKLMGDKVRIGVNDPVVTYNKNLVVFSDGEEKDFGVYDLNNNSVKINAEYDLLYATYNDSFIANKGDKTGIISPSEKILVVFEYDFIDKNKGFYVIGKDNKLAIMNDDYEFVSDFNFKFQKGYDDQDYSYALCCTSFNSFVAERVGDKYLLIINNGSLRAEETNYDVNEAYIISSDGTFETIKEDYYDQVDGYYLFFNSKEQKYRVFDDSLKEKYILDLSNYTYGKKPQYFYRVGNVLGLIGKDTYFDVDTGKEISDKVEFDLKSIKINIDKSIVTIKANDEEIYKFKNESSYASIFEKTDHGYLIQGPKNGKDVLLIEK